jgi:hypothetical protein
LGRRAVHGRILKVEDDVTTTLFVSGLALPSVPFTLLYFPALKLSLALVSPYPKATLRKRMYGAAVPYLLLRDSYGGQSLGKFLVGQVVIHVDTGQRCRVAGSIKRNVFLILPGANLVAVCF